MDRVLPALDLLAHNALAALLAVPVLVVLSQIGAAVVLRVASWFLRYAIFEGVTPEERKAFRRSVQRRALVIALVLGALLLLGALVASFRGVRALTLGRAAVTWMLEQDLAALRIHLVTALGIVLGALIVDALLRALAAVIGKGLSRWKRLAGYHQTLPEVVKRLRAALRAVVLCVAAIVIVTTVDLPTGVLRTTTVLADTVAALYVSRAVSRLWHLVTDVLFGMSEVLAKLEGPLKALGNLQHLKGVTKRAGEYLAYVGAATWVAGQVAAEAWYYSAGQIGLRLIVIFYASRVLVEVCILLVQEMFLGKPEEHTEGGMQRRRTLLPVIVGFLRYGIYFTALIMGLKEAAIDPTPLLAGAGVIGVAIGFGAQTFVGDIVAGFFILFEDLVLVGDLVEVGGVKGEIEEIGVRITRIRSDAGVLHSIPNGEVRKVANHSRKHVNAVVDVYVPYEEDPRRVRALLSTLAARVLEEEGVQRGPVEVKVQELTEGSILLRLIARVPPGKDEELGDMLRARVVEELRAANVGAPRPRRAVILDSTLHVGVPPEPPKEKEEARAAEPFKPPEAGEHGAS